MYGAILGVFGLVVALCLAAFGSLFASFAGSEGMGALMGGGIAMLIFLPLVYFGIGAFIGAIFALIYNAVAPRIGGVKVYTRDA